MEKSKLICKSTLKKMGWNRKLIRELLPEPTKKPNPRKKASTPVLCFWPEDIVFEKMKTEAFINAQEERKARVVAKKGLKKRPNKSVVRKPTKKG